ncbi:hypothetical protein SLEP1_g12907 [Rubroshorea leprosula]|uniref:Uncharacterized protein n=1 Tax=Rubroshorea leprosula TaxID=152421 RepID=A0AAV5IJT8_9ROSI|nr:hypothetical protein SLEP1_g12907 [Rubroshorea leprosula]
MVDTSIDFFLLVLSQHCLVWFQISVSDAIEAFNMERLKVLLLMGHYEVVGLDNIFIMFL